MRTSHIVAIIAALLVFIGYFFFFRGGSEYIEQTTAYPREDSALNPSEPLTSDVSTATNYVECIAEGGQPLPDAMDKCLTKDGHVFIRDVIE